MSTESEEWDMGWLESMNGALDYIEENLSIKMDLHKVAQKAGCSSYNFQRMFSFVAGVTLASYIRRRCMTAAALELGRSDITIMDLALKYGYDSPVSFARAFQTIHGMTPQEARQGKGSLQSYPRISFHITMKGDQPMNYRIETMKAFRVIGKSREISTKDGVNFKEVPKFWDDSCADGSCTAIYSINGREMEEMYGVCYDMNFPEENFRYMIGVKVEEHLVEGMEVLEIPEMLWAKFTCRGVAQIQEVFQRFYTEWLPNSGYEHAEAPEIEWYSTEDMSKPDYLCEVWMPIQKVNE